MDILCLNGWGGTLHEALIPYLRDTAPDSGLRTRATVPAFRISNPSVASDCGDFAAAAKK